MARRPPKRVFKELNHTADLRVEIYGEDVETLFLNAVRAFYSLLGVPDGKREHRDGPETTLEIEGQDQEDALVRLLGELLYRFDAEKERFYPLGISVNASPETGSVSVRLRGSWRTLTPEERSQGREIKAVTYHDAQIHSGPRGLVARVVMDL